MGEGHATEGARDHRWSSLFACQVSSSRTFLPSPSLASQDEVAEEKPSKPRKVGELHKKDEGADEKLSGPPKKASSYAARAFYPARGPLRQTHSGQPGGIVSAA